jgi:predicted ATPase
VTKRILLTGGPGFGKSSIIQELERMEFSVFHEIARQIIQNEVEAGGTALPWLDIASFSAQVLQGRIDQFALGENGLWFYDRGLPDIAGFLRKEKRETPEEIWQLFQDFKYDPVVFITPPWEAIFHRDAERKEDFAAALKVHRALESVYQELGYELVPVPMGSIRWRAQYILNIAGIT